jgi:hypothetical protein
LSSAELQRIEGVGKGISPETIAEIAQRGSFGSLDELRRIIPLGHQSASPILPGVVVKTARPLRLLAWRLSMRCKRRRTRVGSPRRRG